MSNTSRAFLWRFFVLKLPEQIHLLERFQRKDVKRNLDDKETKFINQNRLLNILLLMVFRSNVLLFINSIKKCIKDDICFWKIWFKFWKGFQFFWSRNYNNYLLNSPETKSDKLYSSSKTLELLDLMKWFIVSLNVFQPRLLLQHLNDWTTLWIFLIMIESYVSKSAANRQLLSSWKFRPTSNLVNQPNNWKRLVGWKPQFSKTAGN